MKRGVLFLNGEIDDYELLRSWINPDHDYVIAADGGGAHCEAMGIYPNLALGDFDSLDPALLAHYENGGVEMLSFPRDKDFSDGNLAVEEALKRGCDELLLLGALGGQRIDMELANVLMLLNVTVPAVIADSKRDIRLLRGGKSIVIKNCENRYLSLIPLISKVECGTSVGLMYPLAGLSFEPGESRSLSNIITRREASVSLQSGVALIITQEQDNEL